MLEESAAGLFVDEEELFIFQGEADETDDLAQLNCVAHVDCFMQFLGIILNGDYVLPCYFRIVAECFSLVAGLPRMCPLLLLQKLLHFLQL